MIFAFAKCISLTEINIPEKVESIKQKAFYECLSLKEITIYDKTDYFTNTFGFNTKIITIET
jgi:hypothetical protein